MIRYAAECETDIIKNIFNICFPMEESFTAWFFENVFDYKKTLIYEDDNKIISVIQMLPFDMEYDRKYSCCYIYGVGTLPQFRGKKLIEGLINAAFAENIKEKIDFSILIVQNQSLLDYYKRYGYKNFFSVSEKNGKGLNSALDIRKMLPSDFEVIDNIYRKSTENTLRIIRDDKIYGLNLEMNQDGSYVYMKNGAICAYAFGSAEGECFMASEAFGEDLDAFIAQIAFKLGKSNYKYVTKGKEKVIGMIKPICGDVPNTDGYINMLFN